LESLEKLDEKKKIEILSNFIKHLLMVQAAMVVPLVERYGEEAKEYIKQRLRDQMRQRYKQIAKEKKLGSDLSAFSKLIWGTCLLPLAIIGQKGGTVVEATDRRLVTRDTMCVLLEGWKEGTDKPEIMCEIDSEVEKAMAEAINPNMTYTKYDWGMARGKPYCEFIVELKETPIKH
jgi:hypothetical protein